MASAHDLQEATQSPGETEKLLHHRAECRKGAMEIVDFILALNRDHLGEFWLPCKDLNCTGRTYTNQKSDSGYHLNSTAVLLLRCAIESSDEAIKKACLSSAKTFLSYLDRIHKEHDWDIAEVCLKHCNSTVLRMANTARPLGDENVGVATDVEDNNNIDYFGYSNELASMQWLSDGMLEGVEFDMGDVWDNLGSGSEI